MAYLEPNTQGQVTKFPRPQKESGEVKSRYKSGKQERPISFEQFVFCVARAHNRLTEEAEGYIWLLYYCGVRKSEGFERVASDGEITETHFIVDFHKRKKGGAEVDPLKLPRHWPGVETLVKLKLKAEARKPISKLIYYQEMKERKSRLVKDHWLFPNIQSTEAWRIVKRVLGEEFYPHFLRLSRITEIGRDPSANITRMKSFSGIKSIRILEAYLGVSEEEQDQALDIMNKNINKKLSEKDGSNSG